MWRTAIVVVGQGIFVSSNGQAVSSPERWKIIGVSSFTNEQFHYSPSVYRLMIEGENVSWLAMRT
jgi:hypothetical protein